MALYAIRLPDGSLIRDPEWVSPAAVMAGAHGLGHTRVTGELVRLYDTDDTAPSEEASDA